MPFDWRFRNFKRDPQPFLNGAVIDAENARNNLVQNAGNSMEGYTPLESTLAAQAMEGYKPVIPATQGQLAAGANQYMQGYTPNSVGHMSVPNDMHGGMGQPDLEGYGESLQAASDAAAQEQDREQQIADKEAQIAILEKRIAENQAKLKNWNGGDVANKVAALEARKFFSQDPSSIWRWKTERDEAKRLANEQKNTSDNVVRANALFEIQNDLDSIIVDESMTSQDQKAYLSKLSNLKTLAQKNNLPTDAIDKKIKEVKRETEQPTQEKPESVTEEDFDFEGGPRDVGEARATKILQKDPEKLTQNELATLKRDIVSGKISVSNETKNKIDKLHSQVIDRDKKKNESIKKAKGLVGKKNLTSKEIQFMEGMKGFKKKSDEYGNIWFEEVL